MRSWPRKLAVTGCCEWRRSINVIESCLCSSFLSAKRSRVVLAARLTSACSDRLRSVLSCAPATEVKINNSVHSLTILLICILSLFPRRDWVTERFERDYYASESGASQIIFDFSFEMPLVFGLWPLVSARQNKTPRPKV